MKRIYLDSCVLISSLRTELDPKLRGLYIEADNFFDKVKEGRHILVLSDLFFEEIKKQIHFTKEDTIDRFKKLNIEIEIVEMNQKNFDNEFRKLGIHFHDSLHVAKAIEEKCDCIVTFNLKDFEKAKKFIKIFEPTALF